MGYHSALFKRHGILQMAPYAVDHLLPHLDHLAGQRQAEVTLDEFRHQRVARLVALLDGCLFVDSGRTVGRIDFTAQIERERHLAADESQAAVLQRQLPVGAEERIDEPADGRYHFGRHHAAAQNGLSGPLHGVLLVVQVDADILAKIGIGARDIDLGHAQTDGGPTLLHRSLLLIGRSLERRIVLKRRCERLVERKGLLALLRQGGKPRREHDGN